MDPDNAAVLKDLRGLLEQRDDDVFRWAAEKLTEVRILDMIAWKL